MYFLEKSEYYIVKVNNVKQIKHMEIVRFKQNNCARFVDVHCKLI